jgi:predicted site-specific integrase-resolvase
MQSRFLNVVYAAQFLAVHPATLYLWRKRGRGPAWTRCGMRYRYSQEALEAFLQRGEETK